MSYFDWSSPEVGEAFRIAFALDQSAPNTENNLPDLKDKEIEVLQNEGYLEIPLASPESFLDPEIHPIFRPPNWYSPLPMDEAYEAMKPALTLATKFITTKELLGVLDPPDVRPADSGFGVQEVVFKQRSSRVHAASS